MQLRSLAFWLNAAHPRFEFEQWLDALPKPIADAARPAAFPDYNAWAQTERNRKQQLDGHALQNAFRIYVRELLTVPGTIEIPIPVQRGTAANLQLGELPADKLLASVRIDFGVQESAKGLQIGELRIANSHVELTDCRIGTLVFENSQIELVLKNCWIGHLEIVEGAIIGDCEIVGGGFLSISTPRPGSNIFKGYLEIGPRTYVPTTPSARMLTPNAYLHLRRQLAEVGNTEAAGFFARAEHHFNYRREPGAAKLASFLYWLTSDYGTSVTRPLVWSIGLIALGTALAFAVGPVLDPEFVKASNDEAVSGLLRSTWYAAFLGDGWQVRFARAMAAAWGAAVNPFSVFGDRGVVLMPTIWSNLMLKTIGAFTTLSFAMLFLAIRRRFRLT